MRIHNIKLGNQILSLLMALVMVVSMLPMSSFTAFAADATVTDTAADSTYPYAVVDTAAGTVTIDGALGGKTTAEESDITALVDAIKGYVDSGITTITVTGSNPADITVDTFTITAISEAIYRLSGNGTYSADNSYNGKIDLILPDVTEIVKSEFANAYALNSITLPKVTKLGDLAFFSCSHLRRITFGSVLTEVNETYQPMFYRVGEKVGGCDLILNCGQMKENRVPTPDLTTNTWRFKDENQNQFKSITLTHNDSEATCTNGQNCSVCDASALVHSWENNNCTECDAVAKASLTSAGTVTYYVTLAEAVTAAQSATGSTVQLLDSVTLSNTINITTGQFTIDLNGKTVTSAWEYAFNINDHTSVERANVTIISTVSGGKIESSNGYYSVNVQHGTAKVIGVELNKVRASGTLTRSGTLTLENVKITGSTGVHAIDYSNVTILGNSSISGAERDVTCDTYATITLGEGVTFPDGLTAYSASGYKRLNTMLADGMAYWQGDNKMLRLTSEDYEISGGTVTVKAVCTHEGGTQTYAPIEGGTQHTATYSCCGTTVTEDHSGGTATCQKQAVCEICGTSYGDLNSNNHEYVNGVCACGAIAPIAKNEDGVYEIYVPEHLVEFAQIVNGTHKTISQDKAANAILKDNIDMNGIPWTPICSTGLYYNNSYASSYGDNDTGYAGTFDGDGYAIKNLSVTAIANQTWTYGLFGTMTGTVKNLGIEGFTYNHNGATDMRVGAIVGQNLGGTIENCYVVKATIAPGTNVAGGITGCNYAGTIKNCYVANSTVLASASRYGYIAGDNRADTAGDRVGKIENCYTDGDRLVGSYTGTETGCGIRSERRFASGEVAYLLGSAWGQGETLPVLRGGATVYENLCGGDIFYSTTDGDFDSHDFGSDYRCTNCDNYEAPEQDANGVYQIATPSNFFWFAEEVNKGNITISAVLCNDIDLKGVNWTPIGSEGSPFKGVFDGQNYKIKNLYIHATEGGYYGVFGYLVDGTVKNFSVSGNAVIELSAQEAVYYGVIGAAAARNVNTYVTNVHSTVTLEIKDSFDKNNIAGIVGYAEGKSTNPWYCLYIDRCSFGGSMNFGTAYVDVSGGIAGYVSYNGLVYITNCLYNGTITSECARAQAVGGIVGYNRGLNMYIQNCLSVGTIELKNTGYAGAIAGRYLASGTSVFTYSKAANNYYSGSLPAFSNTTDTSINYYNIDIVDYAEYTGKEATSVTDTQLKSGEVTWLLNGSTTENAVWKQTIGLHDVPGFEGATVNLNGTTYENTGNYIYVEISWTAMEFTYTAGEWDPETHTSGGGTWAAAPGGGQITVTNLGGRSVTAKLTFTPVMEGISGSFDKPGAHLAMGGKFVSTLTLTGTPAKTGFTNEHLGNVVVTITGEDTDLGDVPSHTLGSEITYTWAEDYTTCTASAVCTGCGSALEVQTVHADYAETASSTCTVKGTGTYTATFTAEGLMTQTKEVELPLDPDAHTITTWTQEGITHTGNCDHCGATVTEAHSGGTATCLVGKICEICGFEYDTTKAPDNHVSTEYTYTDNEDGIHTEAHKCCGTVTYEYDESTNTYTVYSPVGLLAWGEAARAVISTGTEDTNNDWYAEYTKDMPNLTLAADITLTGANNWTPLGYVSEDKSTYYSYIGTIDGNGHTITGLNINSTGDLIAFVGSLGPNSEVKNLTFKDATIVGGECVATVVADCGGNVTNCHVTGSSSVSGNNQVAGVIAINTDGIISGCTNAAAVTVNVGDNTWGSGGVVGSNALNGIVMGCFNSGDITASASNGSHLCGGVVGLNNHNASTIIACGNTGNVVSSVKGVGGIAGGNSSVPVYACWTKETTELSNGEVSNKDGVGVDNNNKSVLKACYSFADASAVADAITAMNAAIDEYNASAAEGRKCTYKWQAGTDGYPTLVEID